MEKPVYCSIDLELSGFDPIKDEIIEIGFIFFEMTGGKPQIVEEWSQVFKPHREVHPKILGLTGIKQEELDNAPEFNEHRDFLQKKLGGVILVGHSVSVDARFLEAAGIKLSGSIADTLDLVQFLLPTHHSYNLENLMHYFGISHKEAHRALADSRASISIIERLLTIFQNLTPKLQKQIRKLAEQGEFLWAPWLNIEADAKIKPEAPDKNGDTNAPAEQSHATGEKLLLSPNSIISVPDTEQIDSIVINSIEEPSTYIIESRDAVLKLWRLGLAEGVFTQEDTFSETRFSELLKKDALTPDEIKFILKILVWRETNWQTSCLLDLNTSFFGGQFKWLINGGSAPKALHKVICCDHKTFIKDSAATHYQGRRLIIKSLYDFEKTLTTGIGERVSWNYTIQVLKAIYNPELDHGDRVHKDEVVDTLAATDLFFGLLNLTVERHFHSQKILDFKEFSGNSYYFNKVHKAAANYASKLSTMAKVGSTKELDSIATQLLNMFDEQSNRVKWLEIGENHCMLYNLPLDVTPLTKNILKSSETSFIDSGNDKRALEFLTTRLGITGYSTKLQAVGLDNQKVSLAIHGGQPSDVALLEVCLEQNRPTIVQFPESAPIKEFYDKHYQTLKLLGPVYAERYSGGSNKITRNFSINPQSVMLITSGFMLRQNHRKIPAKTAVWVDLPKEGINHPYQQALAEFYKEKFPDFENILTALQLQILLSIYKTEKIERIELYIPTSNQLKLSWLEAFFQNTHWLTLIPREVR